MESGSKKTELTGEPFADLLKAFGDDPDSDGANYLSIRRRLITFFDRKNADFPEDLADETLMRVARRLNEEGRIDGDPARFCYITARFVFHEWIRESSRTVNAEPHHVEIAAPAADEERKLRELRLSCLEKCVASLDAAKKDLITKYYLGARREKIDNRRELAVRLGITTNALMIRASRIRERLEECVKNCLERAK